MEILRHFANRFAALVHVGLRLAQQQPPALPLKLRHSRRKLLLQLPLGLPPFRQPFDHHETRVVSSPGILRSRVTQAHDEIKVLHARAFSSSRTPNRRPPPRPRLLLLLGLLLGFLSRLLGGFFGALFRRLGRGPRRRLARALFLLFLEHFRLSQRCRRRFQR